MRASSVQEVRSPYLHGGFDVTLFKKTGKKKKRIVWILEKKKKQDKSQEGEKEENYKLRRTWTPQESLAKTKKKPK